MLINRLLMKEGQRKEPEIRTATEASSTAFFPFRFVLCSGPLVCLAQNVPQLKEYLDLKLQSLESRFPFELWLVESTLSSKAPCCIIRYSIRNLLWFILARLFYFSWSIFMKELECDFQVQVIISKVDYIFNQRSLYICLCVYINEKARIYFTTKEWN